MHIVLLILALRIIVTLEPCYLAFRLFESKLKSTNTQSSNNINDLEDSTSTSSDDTQDNISASQHLLLIKYYDTLTSIPTTRDLQKCGQLKVHNTRGHLYKYKFI